MPLALPPPPPAIVRPSEAHEWDRLIDCIAQVESAGNSKAKGKAGERGALQIKRELWEQFTTMPFAYASERAMSDMIARRIFEAWAAELRKSGKAERFIPDILAQWWTTGRTGLLTKAKADYVDRVMALYRERR